MSTKVLMVKVLNLDMVKSFLRIALQRMPELN